MDFKNKATKIDLFNFKMPQMRAFHLTWFAFFLCFFGWFGIVPLIKPEGGVRDSLGLTPDQIGNSIILAVAGTIFARLLIGQMSARYGSRKMYVWLLVLGAIPVMGIGLSQTYWHFALARFLIGLIGASFVITQYHTSVMFAPNVVGTANAMTAGWGNLGGGVTQFGMIAISGFIASNFMGSALDASAWRYAMIVPGIAMILTAAAYWYLTTDAPDGNYDELRAKGDMPPAKDVSGTFTEATKDNRVWALFFVYAICFGIELTMNGTLALYFGSTIEEGGLGMTARTAGLMAASFGLMNLFARATGGWLSDKINIRGGLKGRVRFLFLTLFLEGVFLILFSQMNSIGIALVMLITFSFFVQMAEGATFGIVPFVNKRALGAVAGIVGAGGNFGAVLFGFLFKTKLNFTSISWEKLSFSTAYMILGIIVVSLSFMAFLVRFTPEQEAAALKETKARLAGDATGGLGAVPVPAD